MDLLFPGVVRRASGDSSDEEDACWQDSHTENSAARQAAAVQLDLKGTYVIRRTMIQVSTFMFAHDGCRQF